MDATATVIAFSESPALRETLAVLLEHDCQLRFLAPDVVPSHDSVWADLAVVALHNPTRLLHWLRELSPTLPIVSIDMARDQPPAVLAGPDAGIDRVPLDPHAIRTVVLQRAAEADAVARTAVHDIAHTLRTELGYAFTALRSFSSLQATSAGPETYPLIAAVVREQSHVVGETIGHLVAFRDRPRTVELSVQFASALGRQLERPDALTRERGLLCECRIDAPCSQSGPLHLAAMLARFVHAHLRRRTDATVIPVRITARGVELSYPCRRKAAPATVSWPLLLASLALLPWSWNISSTTVNGTETVSLCAGR